MRQLCYTLVFLLVLLLSASACRTAGTTIQPHAVRHQIDTVNVIKHHTDSVYIKDSIYIHQKNDTIYSERWHTKYKLKYVYRDSIHIRLDSIPYPVEVIKEVKHTPAWIRSLATLGGLMLALLILSIGIKIYTYFRP